MQKAPRRQPGIPSCCPNTRGARGLQIPQQERENHAAGKPRRWRRTTWKGHNQHPPRDELPKRGPRWSSCSLSGGSRAAAKKDEITAAHSAEPAELGGGSEGIYYRVHEARKPQRWSCSASGARADSKRSTDSKRSDPSISQTMFCWPGPLFFPFPFVTLRLDGPARAPLSPPVFAGRPRRSTS